MIVSDKFVWQHFPKCAGHAVDQALRGLATDKGASALSAAQEEVGWHDTVEQRAARQPGFGLNGRILVSGFRRLPYWLLSRVHYEASRAPYLCVSREMLRRGEFFHQNGGVSRADEFADRYTASPVSRWIRTEHLAEDFERAFIDLIPSPLFKAAVRKVRRVVNGTQLNYVRDLGFHFTPQELARLYEANPVWAAVERQVYGDVLTLANRKSGCWYVVSRGLKFVSASQAAVDAWRVSRERLLGRHIFEVFPKVRGSQAHLALLSALQTGSRQRLVTPSPTFEKRVDFEIIPNASNLKVEFSYSSLPAAAQG